MTDISQLISDVGALSKGRVLCIGDVMLDRFIYGDVDRISPEAPIPVLHIERETEMLGGAGNVARNLTGLGAKTAFVSVVGDDATGERIAELLEALDGADITLVKDSARRTSIKSRYIAGSQQMLRADEETIAPLHSATRAALLTAIDRELVDCQTVIMADYNKGVFAEGFAGEVISRANAAGVPVIVDPQGADYSVYRNADLVTPNRKELEQASRLSVDTEGTLVAACQELIDSAGIKGVLATRSADGMSLVLSDQSPQHFAAEAQEVFDVSGAGDTVVATMAAGLASGLPLNQAVELSNITAGIVVGKVGTAVAYSADVIDALHNRERNDADQKITALEPAIDRVARWRAQGLRVGFTNGCFDLLHPGHLAVLAQAKAACDRLVVGLNSDSSTSRLKGPERPIQNELARSAVLASLERVDLVVVFEEDTPANIIEAVQPDVFIKGADYTIEEIPEAKIVQAYGGEVLLAKLEEGHSTTATIARMNS